MSRPPTISVIIPAYNAEPFIEAAVRSVLDQTWDDLECIVVNDGSTDDTATVLSGIVDPRLKVLHQENGGVSRARNAGVAASEGELLAFLDADDVWLPQKLERQAAVLTARPEVGAVLAPYLVTDADLRVRWLVHADNPARRLQEWLLLEGDGPLLPSTLLCRRECIDAAGSFDEAVDVSADLHFAIRLSDVCSICAVDEPLALYRSHDRQIHRDLTVFERNMLKVYEDALSGDAQRHLRRRGTANLYTRLFFHHLRSRELRAAARCLQRALGLKPSRVVLLPMKVGARRGRERLRRLILGPPKAPREVHQAGDDRGQINPTR